MEEQFDYDDIERFVKEEMTGEERSAFERDMQKDPELSREVEFYKKVAGAFQIKGLVNSIGDELNEKAFFDDLDHKEGDEKQRSQSGLFTLRRKIIRRLAYAASFALVVSLLGLWSIQQNYSDQALAATDHREMELVLTPLVSRGIDQGTQKDELAEGLAYLKEEELQKATSFFEEIEADAENRDRIALYLTYAYLRNAAFDKAAANARQSLQTMNDTTNRMKMEWMLVKALAGTGNDEGEILQVLQKIASDPQHLYQQKALKMQKDLKSFWRNFTF